jgi:hypothetical protein
LVAAIMGKDFESLSQRQCSRKPPRFQPVKPHQKSLPIPWLRLRRDRGKPANPGGRILA